MDCQMDLLQMLFLQPKAVKIEKRFTCQNSTSVQKVTLTSVSQKKQFIKITEFKKSIKKLAPLGEDYRNCRFWYFCTGLISFSPCTLCMIYLSMQ